MSSLFVYSSSSVNCGCGYKGVLGGLMGDGLLGGGVLGGGGGRHWRRGDRDLGGLGCRTKL